MAAIPPSPAEIEEFNTLVRARHPLVLVETVEDQRLRVLLSYVAERAALPLFVWDRTRGLVLQGPGAKNPSDTQDLTKALDFVRGADLEALFYFPGCGDRAAPGEGPLEDPDLGAYIKDIYRSYFEHRGLLVFSGGSITLPSELEPLFSPVQLAAPDAAAYHTFVSNLLKDLAKKQAVEVDLSGEDVAQLLGGLHGLTFFEVQKIITLAVVDDGRLDANDLERILDAKRRIIERTGLLQYFPHGEDLTGIAGLEGLKGWLRKRRASFVEPERAKKFGLSPPKGLLLLGVQGCGKSAMAKAIAAEWRLPLVRLDPGSLFQKYFGESERNLRKAIATAEAMAPVVLWIDEVEKALGQGGNDGGTSTRVFGTFLAWLQEKKESVFVVATANDISNLPPELLRKGRFDEIFFVDLPKRETRKAIFGVHLKKRGREVSEFDLGVLADASDGFSGAEIEQAIVSALYSAFAEDRDIDTESVRLELVRTHPLSVTMAEKIQDLRAWATNRAVSAE